MRLAGTLTLILLTLTAGCGRPAATAPAPPPGGAARVLEIAQGLEKARGIKKAVAAYEQIVRHYPGTPEAVKAAARVSQIQAEMLKRSQARQRR
jgi:hypothetical protein